MKLYFYILLITLSVAFSGCRTSEAASETNGEVIFDDAQLASSNNGKVNTDDSFLNSASRQMSAAGKSSEEQTRTLADNSELVVRYDGYGNKTETRSFNNHPRITTLLIRTAANGQKQFYVYGYGKEVKTLPVEMSETALTASAEELANAAGLYETRSNEDLVNFRKQSVPLEPLPSSSFTVQMPQTPAAQSQEIEQNTALPPEENSSLEEESKAENSNKTVTETRQPVEEN